MPTKLQFSATVSINSLIAKDTYKMTLAVPKNLAFTPGQFANVSVGSAELLLKRPISINAYHAKTGDMTLIYKVVGKGTNLLSQMLKGCVIDVLAPLGTGFTNKQSYKDIFLIGGGIGSAPLESIMEASPNKNYTAFLGFDTRDSIYHIKEFKNKTKNLYISTEDGTEGSKGFVTLPLINALKTTKPDAVFACGPTPMLKALHDVFKHINCDAFVSVEERMGCGMGGCAVCVCKTTTGYKKACVIGPVFKLNEVIF